MLTTIYKYLHFANYPKYLKKLLTPRPSIYNLKGTDILSLPKPTTTMIVRPALFQILCGEIMELTTR